MQGPTIENEKKLLIDLFVNAQKMEVFSGFWIIECLGPLTMYIFYFEILEKSMRIFKKLQHFWVNYLDFWQLYHML